MRCLYLWKGWVVAPGEGEGFSRGEAGHFYTLTVFWEGRSYICNPGNRFDLLVRGLNSTQKTELSQGGNGSSGVSSDLGPEDKAFS